MEDMVENLFASYEKRLETEEKKKVKLVDNSYVN